jgi:hypothetical protein
MPRTPNAINDTPKHEIIGDTPDSRMQDIIDDEKILSITCYSKTGCRDIKTCTQFDLCMFPAGSLPDAQVAVSGLAAACNR